MAPLSTYYEQEVRKWLFNHPGRCVTIFEIAKLFNAAYSRAAVAETAVKGFSKTGINPYNPDIFPDHLFAPSVTTDHPMLDLQQEPPVVGHQTNVSKDQEQPSTSSTGTVGEDRPTNLLGDSLQPDQPTLSSAKKELELYCYRPKLPFSISPKCVLPLPQVKGPRPEKMADKRKKKTVVITSSPYKRDLQMEEKERTIKLQDRTKKIEQMAGRRSLFKISKQKSVRKRNGKEEENELPGPAKPESRPTKNSLGKHNPDVKSKRIETFNKPSASSQECMSSSSEDETEGGETCMFCNALYIDSKAGEGWIQCPGCQQWAHEACSNAEEGMTPFYATFVLL